MDIHHVRGSEVVYAGHYNPLTGNLTVHELSLGSSYSNG